MDPIIDFIRNKLIPLAFCVVVFALSLSFIRDISAGLKVVDETKSGYITEKRYVPASSFLFKYTDSHYRIYISVPCENNFCIKEVEKYFIVEKEVYNQYEIGDFFDSTKI